MQKHLAFPKIFIFMIYIYLFRHKDLFVSAILKTVLTSTHSYYDLYAENHCRLGCKTQPNLVFKPNHSTSIQNIKNKYFHNSINA